MNGDAVSTLLNGVSAIVIAGYLGAVLYQRNGSTLVVEAQKDYGYLEFLIAIVILKMIASNERTHDVAIMLIGAAVIAMMLKLITATPVSTGALKDFASGKTGLFDTAKAVFGG